MRSDLLNILQTLSVGGLTELRGTIDELIKNEFRETLGKRKSKRVEMNLLATC